MSYRKQHTDVLKVACKLMEEANQESQEKIFQLKKCNMKCEAASVKWQEPRNELEKFHQS
jgi:hypothetical protein